MPAIWTTPRTWSVGELVTAALLNQHLRDNLEWIKTRPKATYQFNESSNYTISSSSFQDVDATEGKGALTIITSGEDVLIGFSGTIANDTGGTSGYTYFDVAVDGVRMGGDDGLAMIRLQTANVPDQMTFVVRKTDLPAGSHTFKLQWKRAGGVSTLYAGAGTANADMHPQFWVVEELD